MIQLPRCALIVTLICSSLCAPAIQARTLTDMAGRQVVIPDQPRRWLPAITSATPLLAALAPERMVALSFQLAPGAGDFLPSGVSELPVIEVLKGLDAETLLATRADLALGWNGPGTIRAKSIAQMDKLGLPLLLVDAERLDQYPATLRLLGTALDRHARAEQLAHHLETSLAALQMRLADLPPDARPRVYYAESPDGLTSQCDDSSRLEVIGLAGGRPALHCQGSGFANSQTIDFETLVALDPDVILARDHAIAEGLRADRRWRNLRAVRAGRVYGAPELPFNWVDRPPSFMRALGASWLAWRLHPARHPGDFTGETRAFIQLFFGVTPSETACRRLLRP